MPRSVRSRPYNGPMIRIAESKTASDLSIRAVGLLREAVWLTRRRLFSYSTILIATSAAIISWTLTGHGINDPAGRPVGTDFVSFWTVSSALMHGNERTIYSPEALAALEQAVLPRENMDFYAWQYPPIALLLVYPLAFLPYLWSLASWLAVGAACYLTVLWRILPQPLTLLAGLAFPAVLLTVGHGQNSLLTTGLFAWGLLLLEERPMAAGVVIGLLSFKPQLGVLLPVALLAGGHRRTMVAATLTSLGLAATTVILFGGEIWSDFLESVQLSRDILDEGLVPYYKMQSVFAAVRLLGGPSIFAYGLQAIVAVSAAVMVAWVWRRPTDSETKNAALMTATPLATPFFLDYDLMLVAPAIALLARRGVRHGQLPWEGTALAVLSLVPLVSRTIGAYVHILLAPLAIGAVFACIIAGIRASAHPHEQALRRTTLG
jgi:alpha-1,2-mannosyltransferase